jgi:anti-anti-sigma regulatory factor
MYDSEPTLSALISYNERWRVALWGEVDRSARDRLLSLATALATSGNDPVDFDLSGVTFIDRAGWLAVSTAAAMLQAAGAAARIINPSPAVRRLTDLMSRVALASRSAPPGFAPAA